MYGGQTSILCGQCQHLCRTFGGFILYLVPATAAESPWFLVWSMPSRRLLAQKSLLAPYMTWTNWESIRSARSKDSADVNGTGFGARVFSKTELA
jgi:hypothetical protein